MMSNCFYFEGQIICWMIALFFIAIKLNTSLLQHHSSKASILLCSASFTVQLSHPYMTTGKTIALTRRIFVGKVKSLLFNMLSRLVTSFLPRNKYLFISWRQLPSAVILEPPKNSFTVPIILPSICHEVMSWRSWSVMILVFWMLSFKPTFSLSSFTLLCCFQWSYMDVRVEL